MLHWPLVIVVAHVAVIVRALLVEGRDPYSRAAWVLALLLFPIVAPVAYLMVGEPWVSAKFRRQADRAYNLLIALESEPRDDQALKAVPRVYHIPFKAIEQIGKFGTAGGNHVTLTTDSNAAISEMVSDIDAARRRVHLTTYIWLIDHNGLAIVDALMRAAKRGVRCRVCADAIGSRQMIRSEHWEAMQRAGISLCRSLRVPYGLSFLAAHRVDLRNHRKMLIIDGGIAFVGSQNLADPEFRIKPKFAPWIDIMLRVEGPVVAQHDILFASDWVIEMGEDLSGELHGHITPSKGNISAVSFGTGPLSHRGSMSQAFASVLYCAQEEVTITTPYFVPDPPLLSALIGCAQRGVVVSLVLPRRNDSRVIGAISKALYPELVKAGVRLFEYRRGLLHSKTIVIDQSLCLIGSSNMDRRSLELNFENNMLFYCPETVAAVVDRQRAYLALRARFRIHDVRASSIFVLSEKRQRSINPVRCRRHETASRCVVGRFETAS